MSSKKESDGLGEMFLIGLVIISIALGCKYGAFVGWMTFGGAFIVLIGLVLIAASITDIMEATEKRRERKHQMHLERLKAEGKKDER